MPYETALGVSHFPLLINSLSNVLIIHMVYYTVLIDNYCLVI